MMRQSASDTLPPQQAAIRDACTHPTGRFVAFARDEIEQSITDRFEEQVRRFPEELAVKSGNDQLTYYELNIGANRVADAVLNQVAEGCDTVGVLLGHDAASIVAMLGVLKAGKPYVPLDPSYPRERLHYILQDSQAGLILTDDKSFAVAREMARDDVQLMNIDRLDASAVHDNPGVTTSPDALAYVLYTSGSTGQPKGVTDRHRNVLHQVMLLTNDFHVCSEDRVVHLHSFGFSASVRKIFPALLNGASIHMRDIKRDGVMGLASWLAQSGITIFGGRGLVRDVAGSVVRGQAFPDLRLVTLGGDSIYASDVELCREAFAPDATFVSGLATTETGTISQYFLDKNADVPGPIVPVGYPVADKHVLLLDESGQEVDAAEQGEIAVKSPYLSPGYWRRPDLDQAKFVSGSSEAERMYLTGDLGRMKSDRCLSHLGRRDFQVKIRGHTVEVAETEAALLRSGMVKDVVVVGHEDGPDSKRLVAYFVPDGEPTPTISDLRRVLSEVLPDYLMPSSFVVMDALPRTATDKVDRRALPTPDGTRPELDTAFLAPRTPVEEALAHIWADVIGLDQVGIDDDFMELGGDSLRASRVASRVTGELGVDIPLRSLLQAPTVADMALAVTQSHAAKKGDTELASVLAELEAMSSEQVRKSRADQKSPRTEMGA